MKPQLLLLPGLHGTGDLFQPLQDSLSNSLDVEKVEYPLDEPLDYNQLMALVTNCIPKENPYFILGESFSGPLAVMAASKHPENLLGVVLAGSFVTSPVPRWLNRFSWLLRGPMLDVRPRTFIVNRLLGRNCPENTRRWVHEMIPRLKRDVLAARIASVLNVNVREELKSIKAPIMYIAGSGDWLVSRKSIDAVWLCRPDVEIRVLDAAHMVLQTRPEEAARVIREFSERSL